MRVDFDPHSFPFLRLCYNFVEIVLYTEEFPFSPLYRYVEAGYRYERSSRLITPVGILDWVKEEDLEPFVAVMSGQTLYTASQRNHAIDL